VSQFHLEGVAKIAIQCVSWFFPYRLAGLGCMKIDSFHSALTVPEEVNFCGQGCQGVFSSWVWGTRMI